MTPQTIEVVMHHVSVENCKIHGVGGIADTNDRDILPDLLQFLQIKVCWVSRRMTHESLCDFLLLLLNIEFNTFYKYLV